MRLSPDKILHLSERLANTLDLAEDENEDICIKDEEDDLCLKIRTVINQFVQRDAEMSERARSKVRSLRRGIPEGSAEFDALYRQFYDEEQSRLRKTR